VTAGSHRHRHLPTPSGQVASRVTSLEFNCVKPASPGPHARCLSAYGSNLGSGRPSFWRTTLSDQKRKPSLKLGTGYELGTVILLLLNKGVQPIGSQCLTQS
jgi:hypothetical protein